MLNLHGAFENLRDHQEQADMHGEFVKVSRQAVCEVLERYERMVDYFEFEAIDLSALFQAERESMER